MLWGVAAGNALLALGVNAFYLPNGLAVGGSTGVGIILYRLWGLDPSMTVLVINTALLVLGWLVVGKEFVVSSVLGSYLYPMFLKLFQGHGRPVRGHPLLGVGGQLVQNGHPSVSGALETALS